MGRQLGRPARGSTGKHPAEGAHHYPRVADVGRDVDSLRHIHLVLLHVPPVDLYEREQHLNYDARASRPPHEYGIGDERANNRHPHAHNLLTVPRQHLRRHPSRELG